MVIAPRDCGSTRNLSTEGSILEPTLAHSYSQTRTQRKKGKAQPNHNYWGYGTMRPYSLNPLLSCGRAITVPTQSEGRDKADRGAKAAGYPDS